MVYVPVKDSVERKISTPRANKRSGLRCEITLSVATAATASRPFDRAINANSLASIMLARPIIS